MDRPAAPSPSWTDDQLADAIRASTNWVSVMRALGFGARSSSAGAIRIVRRRAAELGLDASHFLFFIIDGDLTIYLIPSRAIAGRLQVLLRTYRKYIVGNAVGLLGANGAAVGPTEGVRASA